MAASDENWILWNFYDKKRDYTDISKQVPKISWCASCSSKDTSGTAILEVWLSFVWKVRWTFNEYVTLTKEWLN